MEDQTGKSYHRGSEVAEIYNLFLTGRDVSMPGPRRLGKTFLLERLVEAAPRHGWRTVKVEVAGCTKPDAVFRELCQATMTQLPAVTRMKLMAGQRGRQLLDPQFSPAEPWYTSLLGLDQESFFSYLLETLNADETKRWAILIDELPIFLKALHDQGPDGIAAARNFMNLTSSLRTSSPRVRWMITGSIGLEPLAQAGNYMGVLAKFQTFELKTLTPLQAIAFVRDLATEGRLVHRQVITEAEAEAIVATVGWCAAFYLDALAQKVKGIPSTDRLEAERTVEQATQDLLKPKEIAAFGTWEEHLQRHYLEPDKSIAIAALNALCSLPQGTSLDHLLAIIGKPQLTRAELFRMLGRLDADGFITGTHGEAAEPVYAFLNPLLRRWWQRFVAC